MILNEKVFVKNMILNYVFFALSDFELKLFRLVRFWIKNYPTCEILNQLFLQRVSFAIESFTTR